MIEENMEQVDLRENGFALEVKNFLIGRVYLNIFRCKIWVEGFLMIEMVTSHKDRI